MIATSGIVLVPSFTVLATWTISSPLEWTRVHENATDMFNRSIASYGKCDSGGSFPFFAVLIAIHFAVIVIGNWGNYKCRNIETANSESRYIGISVAALFQALCMGVPIGIVVWDDPQSRFYVLAGIVFVTAQAMLSLIYVPKVYYLWYLSENTIFVGNVGERSNQAFTVNEPGVQHSANFKDNERNQKSSAIFCTEEPNSDTPSGNITKLKKVF
jgi:hypothetical protein